MDFLRLFHFPPFCMAEATVDESNLMENWFSIFHNWLYGSFLHKSDGKGGWWNGKENGCLIYPALYPSHSIIVIQRQRETRPMEIEGDETERDKGRWNRERLGKMRGLNERARERETREKRPWQRRERNSFERVDRGASLPCFAIVEQGRTESERWEWNNQSKRGSETYTA